MKMRKNAWKYMGKEKPNKQKRTSNKKIFNIENKQKNIHFICTIVIIIHLFAILTYSIKFASGKTEQRKQKSTILDVMQSIYLSLFVYTNL